MSQTEANDDNDPNETGPDVETIDGKQTDTDDKNEEESSETTSDANEDDTDDFSQISDQNNSKHLEKRTGEEPIDEYDGYSDWEYNWECTPDTRFEDIGGYESVKDKLERKVIKPHKDEKGLYDHFNVDEINGVLFHGPPGTGKTLFARALANELGRTFVDALG